MKEKQAIFAGGCFWGMEELFRHLPGVINTKVGYTGGSVKNPTYDDLKTGLSGHAESLKITYNEDVISYKKLLEFLFSIHDPTTVNRQGNDRGSQYRSAIFYLDDDQKKTAESVIAEVEKSKKWPGPVVTQVVKAGPFYEAEGYHQNYLQNFPDGYTCHFVRPNWKL
jgi:peptide-methionine (S)-S-oxide reductase